MQDAKMQSTAGLSSKMQSTAGLGSWTFLFLLCINDLPQTVEVGQLVLFGDGINLLIIERDEKFYSKR
jgi:hypothetical protein